MAQRKLSAILAADVVGFSTQMGENEERTLKTLTTCREIISTHVSEHQGRIFGSAGDSVIAEFSSPVEACNIVNGNQTAAEAQLAKALEMNPGLSVAYFEETYPGRLRRFTDALVIAGLKK